VATITGTPTKAGEYNYSVFGVDANGQIPIKFTGTIAPAATALSITSTPGTGPVKVGVAYSATCTITRGTAPYKINYSALPASLDTRRSSDLVATITGTPTKAGDYNYSVFGVDANGQIPINFTGTIAPAATAL